ncbi:MAG: lytic transglycosylase domain-containing protein [bacterium]|nr:lytic transglycosylase domain-containing protein [bacterium]
MQKTIQNLIAKIYSHGNFLLSGALMLGLFQFPSLPIQTLASAPLKKSVEATIEQLDTRNEIAMTEAFFGLEAKLPETKAMIDKKVEFVSTRGAYPASLAVIEKHEDTIREKAIENGVPQDVAIGVGLLENGGSDTAKSPAGALGVYQLMPGTARSLGLKVTKSIDERKIPEKNIDAGMRYLKGNFERFGDWGLATWAYHAGEGNVSNAIKIYAKANHNVTLAGVKDAKSMRAYVEKYGITIHKLLSDPAVKKFTNKLKDDSQGYPYKVIATAKLFKEKPEKGEKVNDGVKIKSGKSK